MTENGFITSLGVGAYQASEYHVAILPKQYKGDGTVRGVIYCPGHGDKAYAPINAAFVGQYEWVVGMAQAGYPVLSCDLGNGLTWGNSTVRSRIAAAKTYLQGTLGAAVGTVFVSGTSMGGVSALGYAQANPSSVAGLVLVGPVCDLNDMVANNRGGFASEINSAYGGAYVEATHGATYNPVTVAAAGGYAGLPVQAWYGASDTIVIPSTVTSLVASVGGTAQGHSLTGGHAESTWAQVAEADVATFLNANA